MIKLISISLVLLLLFSYLIRKYIIVHHILNKLKLYINHTRKIVTIPVAILLIFSIGFNTTACTNQKDTNKKTDKSTVATTDQKDKQTEKATEKVSEQDVTATPQVDLASIPSFTNTAYVAINNNVPYFDDTDKKRTDVFEIYSDLDSMGRCGIAYANICKEIMPTEERGKIGSVKPSGWQSVKYDNVDGKYLYNRCHLIGYQLAGENANEKNLITGTRYLNIEGMLPFENMVNDYVDETNNHVLYRVTPIFDGNNLVASGVLMEGYSVEDAGAGISFCVYCYNAQAGISIDYATGNSGELSFAEEELTEATSVVQEEPTVAKEEPTEVVTSQASVPNPVTQTYIINTNTKKFHFPSCKSVNQIAEKNRQEFTGTRDELIAQGYSPCKNCNP